MEALFTRAKNWKEPRYPSVKDYINKLVCPYNQIPFSNKKGANY